MFKISWKIDELPVTDENGVEKVDLNVSREESAQYGEEVSKSGFLRQRSTPMGKEKDSNARRNVATAVAGGTMFGSFSSGLGMMAGMLAAGMGTGNGLE